MFWPTFIVSFTRNRDEWKNIGLELNYLQQFNNKWTGNIGLTLQNPEGKSGSNGWQQDGAKIILNVGTTYSYKKFSADARLFAYLNREPSYYTYDMTTAKVPDHNLPASCDMTLTLTYRPTTEDTLKLIGRNLFNRRDLISTYGYYGAPINVALTYDRAI